MVSRYGSKYAQRVDLMKKLYQSEWLNAEDDEGLTPIMKAYTLGSCNNECARVLLTKGANLNCKDKKVEYIYFSVHVQ